MTEVKQKEGGLLNGGNPPFEVQRGRYCLNDFHQAAGGENHQRPSLFTRTDQFKSLEAELSTDVCFDPVKSVRGGNTPGTYVVKELVYAC